MTKLNRRKFISSAATAGVGLTTLSMTGIASASPSPKPGGTFRIAIDGGSATDTLDPAKLTVEYPKLVADFTFDNLLWVRHDGKLEGLIASEWSSNDAGTVWTFKIDKRATFTDGRKVTIKDIIYSFNLHMGKNSKSAVRSLLKQVKNLKAKGNDAIVFTLQDSNYEFPTILTDYHFRIVQDGETNWSKPIGTGQYVIESFAPGIKAKLKRVNNDWANRKSYVDTFNIIAVNDPNARINALLGGSCDLAIGLDFKIAKRIEKSSRHSLDITKAKTHYIFPMDVRTDTFKDINVRKAMKHAMNREKMVTTILNGYGYTGNDHPISKTDPMFNADIKQTTFDPDKAKHYLKKAGLSNLKITGHVSDAAYAGAINAMTIFSEFAKHSNIEVNIKREPADGYWSNIWLKKPFCTSYWGGRPTALATLEVEASSNASWNDSHWKNKEFDGLLKSAKGSKDFNTRRDYVMEAQAVMNEHGGVITPMFAYDVNGIVNHVKGMKPHVEKSYNLRRLHETVWLDN